MALNLMKFCPHCRSMFEQGPQEIGIGTPLVNCPACKGVIVDADRTEWELKSPIGKAFYLLLCGWTSIFWGFGFLMLGLALRYKFDVEISDAMLINLWIGGGIGVLMLLILFNWKDIEESRERMKDPRYRERLKRAGLLKN